jgi:hypothetical protein
MELTKHLKFDQVRKRAEVTAFHEWVNCWFDFEGGQRLALKIAAGWRIGKLSFPLSVSNHMPIHC